MHAWREPSKKSVRRLGGEILQFVRSGLFQPRCRICGCDLVCDDENVICRDCREKIRPDTENRCGVCGKFIPEGMETCGSCLLAPPPYERHASYAAYEETLRKVIILYKFGEVEPLKHLLARLFHMAVASRLPGDYDAVVPVPADRRRRRGFQPLRAVGKVLARRLGIPFRPGLLVKRKSTPPQVGLTRARRLANLDGAFALGRGTRAAGLRVLLIDDVTTTGTTLRRCASVLRRAGARVTALTLAQPRF
ncbi:MAG: ComF family protein [Candidatus Aminicenantes bacterium]|nr:ComF family protein [Candidatus Aminicenantes bacterium]